jgi:hypothetical protein
MTDLSHNLDHVSSCFDRKLDSSMKHATQRLDKNQTEIQVLKASV